MKMKIISVKYLAVSLVIALILISSAGCSVISGLTSSTQTTTSTATTTSTTTTPVQSPITSRPPITTVTPSFSLPSVADVVAKVKPSVVAINTEISTTGFFGPTTQEGAGSGWIIRQDGLIITNNHVVQDASSISVTLDDGRTFPVDLGTVKTDTLTDLAVLKIDASNLPTVEVGDSSKMRIGDWVVAIGNALGEGTRATQGIVSRTNVSETVDQTEILYGLIETDAAINPGNSGGPLVDMAGQVIGITSAKLAAVGIEATGFAISTETAMPVINQLISTGHAIHPWLGVSLYPIDQLAIQDYKLSVSKGALVLDVSASSPASLAGLQPNDVIVGFAGKTVNTVDDLVEAIRLAQVGQKVDIIYWRGTAQHTTTATLVEQPS